MQVDVTVTYELFKKLSFFDDLMYADPGFEEVPDLFPW